MDRVTQVLLASAARTTTAASDDQGYRVKGAFFYLAVSAAPTAAVGSLTLELQGKDPVSDAYVTFSQFESVALVAGDTLLFVAYPNEAGAYPSHVQHYAGPLPAYRWRARVLHGDAGSWTYSLSASFLE